MFYAREPYSNADAVHVTRFLGLASVGNKEKQVFLIHNIFLLQKTSHFWLNLTDTCAAFSNALMDVLRASCFFLALQ